MLAIIISSLEDSKAANITKISLSGKTTIADFMVVASGTSRRHFSSTADHACRKLKESGYGKISVEGQKQCDWVLIDSGDFIVHLFRPEIRDLYALEKMWSANLSDDEGKVAGGVVRIL